MHYSVDYEKLFFLYSLKNPKYLRNFYPGFFASEDIDALSNLAVKFHERFNESPTKEQLKLLVQKSKFSDKITNNVIDVIFDENMSQYEDSWLKQIAESWIKWRNFDQELIKLYEYVKMQNVTPDNVENVINTAIDRLVRRGNISFDDDLGADFFIPESHRQELTKRVSSGKDFVDRLLGGGYDTKTLITYIGEPGIGKSIWLCNDAASFMVRGFNVLYVSAEMGFKKVTKRIGSNVLNIKMDEYDKVSQNTDLIKRKLQNVSSGVMPPGKLIVKEYPTSSVTVPEIEAFVSNIEEKMGFKIQVVIIDYMNILLNYRNPNTENTYMKIKQISEDLRGMAVRKELFVLSATQVSKGAWDSTDVRLEDIAESSGLVHTCDLIFAIIQDSTMHGNNEYWLKVLKIRDGEGKGTKCKFGIDYSHMKLTETNEVLRVSNN